MIKSHLWLAAPRMGSRGPKCSVHPPVPGDHLRINSTFNISAECPLINPLLSSPPGTVSYSSPVLVKHLTKSYTKQLLNKWTGGFKCKNKTGYFCILAIRWRVYQGRPKTNDKAMPILCSPTPSQGSDLQGFSRSNLFYHEYWRERGTSPRNKYAC